MVFSKPRNLKQYQKKGSDRQETIIKKNYETGQQEAVLLQDHLNGAVTSEESGLRKLQDTDRTFMNRLHKEILAEIEKETNIANLTDQEKLDHSKKAEEENLSRLARILAEKEKELKGE